MILESWYYFIALESDLEATARFVEPSELNDNAYSVEFARLLMSAAAEIEIVGEQLIRKRDPGFQSGSINDVRIAFQKWFPGLPTMEVLVPRASRKLVPWSSWAGPKNPVWWQAYNCTKHDRHNEFNKATLRNTLNAVAALMCLQLYLHHELYANGSLAPWSRLLTLADHYQEVVCGDGGTLPDFA